MIIPEAFEVTSSFLPSASSVADRTLFFKPGTTSLLSAVRTTASDDLCAVAACYLEDELIQTPKTKCCRSFLDSYPAPTER